MSDTFLPGSGFDTYEQQDKVLVGLCGGTGCKAAVRILQQQGFAVQTFTAEHEVTPAGLLQLLADKAAELDCAFIATGHYARIEVDWPASWLRRPLPRPTCASPPCWRRLTGWASSTLPPATAPG